MQLSKRELNRHIEKQVLAALSQVFCDTKDPEEVAVILTDLLSKDEYMVIAKRLAIAIFLDKGRSYENIGRTLKVSSATVAKVAEMKGNQGMQLALRKVKAEEWAQRWTTKLKRLLK